MERAFEKNGPLRLSDENQEQIRAKQVYRGVMTFFRNAAGHNVTDSYTQEDALRFAVLADLFLAMVEVSLHRAARGEGKDHVGGTSVPYRSFCLRAEVKISFAKSGKIAFWKS
jgi:hypothetical protein